VYRAAREISLERAIARFIERGPELQRAAAVRASQVRTMDQHFADLFARYAQIAPAPAFQPAMPTVAFTTVPEMALARSAAAER
jgi:alpha-1,6-mannosyltransferase